MNRLRPGIGTALLLAAALGLFFTGCRYDTTDGRIYLDTRGWYRDQTVTVPFFVDGSSRYAEYTYEYDDGSAWVTSLARTIRVPGWGSGVIEFEAVAAARDHRLTASVLGSAGPGETLVPVDTVVQRFHIDTTTPAADSASLTLNLYVGGATTPLAEPLPASYDPAQSLDVEVDHVEFDNPSGSRAVVFVTWDGSVPNEWSERIEHPSRFTVWHGGAASYYYELKFIVIDEAGNRSAVRQLILQAP